VQFTLDLAVVQKKTEQIYCRNPCSFLKSIYNGIQNLNGSKESADL
jgi:hypothetical protein